MITNWGYKLTELDQLPEMLTLDGYERLTGGRYKKDVERVQEEILAASTAIRNYVGWHLFPSAACEVNMIMNDRRISRVGRDLLIQLPARYVEEVTCVTIDGEIYTHTYAEASGLLRVFDVTAAVERYAPVIVRYTAGLPEELMSAIKELIAYRVTHSVAVPAGITSEASGGVSVTYNANWINNSRATALVADNREVLIPYRVQGVF